MKTPEEMAEEYADLCVSDAYYAPLKAGFLAGYQAAKEEANFSTSAKWISVKERLPEEGQDCLFYVDWIDVWEKGSERITYQEIGVFNGKDRFYHRAHTDLKNVTHWMPLPKPPEEEV